MSSGFVASTSIEINAPIEKVWDALTNPELIKKYMFGTTVITDWKEGSPILWTGTWDGRNYQGKGMIIRTVQYQTLQLTHFSPLSGVPDKEENYHTLVYSLSTTGKNTLLHFTQDNNPNEESRDHSQKNWQMMFQNLRDFLEK